MGGGIHSNIHPTRRGTQKEETTFVISSWINPYCIRDFSRLEVALQQAGESLAVTGLVAGHLSRRRAGRFASYGETQEIQCFPLPFHS